MTDLELAEEIERHPVTLTLPHTCKPDSLQVDIDGRALTYEENQQIIAALRRGPLEREFSPFWLIERGQAVHHEPTIWWKGGDVRTWPSAGEDWKGKDWTENAPEARRFKTREEALQLAKILFGDRPYLPPSFSITEHSLVDKHESPPSGEMVMVPRELTPAMHEAGLRFAGTLHANYEDCWKALLSAASGANFVLRVSPEKLKEIQDEFTSRIIQPEVKP